MEYKDYYKIMGLESSATPDEIKRAYRKLARKYHPDVSKEPDAEEKFKALGEAYEVLKDKTKRAQYDKYGAYWKNQSQGQAQGRPFTENTSSSFGPEEQADFNEFINSLFKEQFKHESFYQDFGQRQPFSSHRPPPQQPPMHAKLTISLEESFHGTEKSLQLQLPPTSTHAFDRSNLETHTIKVKIPPGVTDKQQLRLKQPLRAKANLNSDLYLDIHIKPHPFFHLRKKDLYLELPITPWEAALGATIQVPTLAGTVNLKIPKLSQSKRKMRLQGRGLPGNPAGDQYVILNIVIAPTEDPNIMNLYQQLAKDSSFNPRQDFEVHDGK